jgi:transcriptional regulator with XRE-family HTH domain
MTVQDTIRAAIRVSGASGYALAKASGVSQATISRFLRGGTMDGDSIDVLAAHLGLTLVAKPGKTKGAR